jgi:long-subunit acyl-CoA synthetase (AMP-forming)
MLYNSSIADILLNLHAQEPLTELIFERGKGVSVEMLYREALNLALNLQEKGFKKGDKVVIATAPSADFVKIIYALIFLQGKVAIIDPEMGRDNYKSKLKQINPDWAFVDTRLLLLQEHPILRYFYLRKSKSNPYFPYTPTAKTIACGIWLPLLQRKWFLRPLFQRTDNNVRWAESANPDNDFLITYTSGTLTEPKGVVHSFASLHQSLYHIGNQLDTSEERLVATYLPHYLLIAISVKIPAILYDPKLSAADKLVFFEQHQVSTIMGPPSDFLPMIQLCESECRQFPACIRHIMLGSAPVTRRFLQRLCDVLPAHVRITCLYGMTEHLLVATIDGRFKKDYDCEGDLLGKPVEGVQLQFVDNEILVRSEQLFSRYFHLSERDAYHSTGDLGELDKNGYLILHGRKKDMIIRRNFNIYPAIYESTINRIDGITEAVLVGVYDDVIHDEKVYLVVEGTINDKKALFEKIRHGTYSIDAEAMPDDIVFMTLPRSGRQHKVNKEAIRKQLKK